MPLWHRPTKKRSATAGKGSASMRIRSPCDASSAGSVEIVQYPGGRLGSEERNGRSRQQRRPRPDVGMLADDAEAAHGARITSRTVRCCTGIIIASVLPVLSSTTCRLARMGHGPGGRGTRGTVLDFTVARTASVPPGTLRLRYWSVTISPEGTRACTLSRICPCSSRMLITMSHDSTSAGGSATARTSAWVAKVNPTTENSVSRTGLEPPPAPRWHAYFVIIVHTPSQSGGGGMAMKCSERST
jgi:hypothetical protein